MIVDLNLENKKIIIVGAGNEAIKRIKSLQNQNCEIIVVSDSADKQITKLAKTKKIKFITTFHGTYGHHSKLKRWYNGVMIRSQQTIAVSAFIKEHVLAVYSNKPTAIEVIHRGIDTEKFNPERINEQAVSTLADAWSVPKNVKVIMLPGRITNFFE